MIFDYVHLLFSKTNFMNEINGLEPSSSIINFLKFAGPKVKIYLEI